LLAMASEVTWEASYSRNWNFLSENNAVSLPMLIFSFHTVI